MSDSKVYGKKRCKVCGLGEVEHDFAICDYCGWEADGVQNDDPDYMGGANDMSLNQYKQFWEENKEELLKHKENLPPFEKAREYYEKKFKKKHEAYLRKINPDSDEVQERFEENRLRNKSRK